MPVFSTNIQESLNINDRIEIGGKIKQNAKKMSVNLCAQTGEEPKDVVLHFDVRFYRDNIISLSRKNGIWIGSGNYDTNYNMFIPGSTFKIAFEIKDVDVITIYCQGKFHSNFLPKIPLCMAKFVVAWGDIERVSYCYLFLGNKTGCERMAKASSPWAVMANTAATAITDDVKCQRTQKYNKRQTDEGHADIYNIKDAVPDSRKNRNQTRSNNYKLPKDSNCDRGILNTTELSDCSEEIFNTVDYSNNDMTYLKKTCRRKNKFPFFQVVNFMSGTRKL